MSLSINNLKKAMIILASSRDYGTSGFGKHLGPCKLISAVPQQHLLLTYTIAAEEISKDKKISNPTD